MSWTGVDVAHGVWALEWGEVHGKNNDGTHRLMDAVTGVKC